MKETNNRLVRPGIVSYQTRALPQHRAISFAKCLSANGRFSIAETITTKRDGYSRVAFVPVNPDRQGALKEFIQDVQNKRADTEGSLYEYTLLSSGRYICKGKTDTYEVTSEHCTCKHFTYRLEDTEIHCKHQVEAIKRGLFSK